MPVAANGLSSFDLEESRMSQVDVTWLRAFKVSWSLFWRVAVYLAMPCVVLSFVILSAPPELLLDTLGPPNPWIWTPASILVLAVLALAIATFFGTWFVKVVLGKAYSDFRIVLEGSPKRYKIEPRL
jgi:hypothetical protein